jgi:hypothetical protein
MATTVTLAQVEELAAQLPLQGQLRLLAHISERVCEAVPVDITEDDNGARAPQVRLAEVDAWLADCEEVAAMWEGNFDSAADLRRIRDEEA